MTEYSLAPLVGHLKTRPSGFRYSELMSNLGRAYPAEELWAVLSQGIAAGKVVMNFLPVLPPVLPKGSTPLLEQTVVANARIREMPPGTSYDNMQFRATETDLPFEEAIADAIIKRLSAAQDPREGPVHEEATSSLYAALSCHYTADAIDAALCGLIREDVVHLWGQWRSYLTVRMAPHPYYTAIARHRETGQAVGIRIRAGTHKAIEAKVLRDAPAYEVIALTAGRIYLEALNSDGALPTISI